MASFGKASRVRLETCDQRLQDILNEAINVHGIDFSVLCGHRSEAEQNELFNAGKSMVKYPDSKHNSFPSMAVDIAPYPINWEQVSRFAYVVGIIQGIAHTKGVKLRVGFDWDADLNFNEHRFQDWPHIEILED